MLENLAVQIGEQVAGDFIRQEAGRSRQAVLVALYKITIITKEQDSIINFPQNKRVINLARSLSDLIGFGCLDVRGKFQSKIWEIATLDLGCRSSSVLWVGPDFKDEYRKRPDSMRGEMLLNMSSAAFADNDTTEIGVYKTLDDVKSVIAGYFKTFPNGIPMTDEQRLLVRYYS